MKYTQVNNVKIYSVNTNYNPNVLDSAHLAWSASAKTRKNLNRKYAEFEKRLHLLQDFGFPVSCGRIQYSKDGRFLMATGTYKPHLKIYDLSELSLKLERHTDVETLTFETLDNELRKIVFLQSDQTLEFHAHFGNYHRLRLPIFGRDLLYHKGTCDLYIGGSSARKNPGILRLNLDEGRHNEPLSFPIASGSDKNSLDEAINGNVNALALNESFQFIAAGGAGGMVHIYDPRSKDLIGSLNVPSSLGHNAYSSDSKNRAQSKSGARNNIVNELFGKKSTEITALSFSDYGMQIAAGTSDGIVAVYDIRGSSPLAIKDHHHEEPIKRIKFHTSMGKTRILSTDSCALRIWSFDSKNSAQVSEPASSKTSAALQICTGSNITNLTTINSNKGDGPINDFVCNSGEGLILVARDSPRMDALYIPELGVAPRWCHFLDGLAEELEQASGSSKAEVGGGYDNYVFCTMEDLQRLRLDILLDARGKSKRIHPYMHGFYVDKSTYKAAIATADQGVHRYKDYLNNKIEDLKRKETGSRATAALEAASERVDTKHNRVGADGSTQSGTSLTEDTRFTALATNKDFAIDKSSSEYRGRIRLIESRLNGSRNRHGGDADSSDEETRTLLDLYQKAGPGLLNSPNDLSLGFTNGHDHSSDTFDTSGDESGVDSDKGGDDHAKHTKNSLANTLSDSGLKNQGSHNHSLFDEDESEDSDDGYNVRFIEDNVSSTVPLGLRISSTKHSTNTEERGSITNKEFVFKTQASQSERAKEKKQQERDDKLKQHMAERAASRRSMIGVKGGKKLMVKLKEKKNTLRTN